MTPERAAKVRKWASRSPERRRAQSRRWLLNKYGITVQQFDDMLSAQGHACALCRTAFGNTFKTKPRVDHCHETGVLRGLLCIICNTGLGCFRDRPDVLRFAAQYVESSKAGGS